MRRTFLATVGVLAVMALGVGTANAGMVLYIDDLATAGVDVVILDEWVGAPVATGAAFPLGGAFTNWTELAGPGGSLGTPGFISYSGMVGPFIVNVSTGLSKPVIGPNRIDIASVNVTGAAGTIEIGLTDTGFIGAGLPWAPWFLENQLSGTTMGTVTSTYFADALNREFSTPQPGPLFFGPFLHGGGPFGPGAFSGTETRAGFGPVFPFSISNLVTITHNAAGQVTSLDSLTSVIPAPGAVVLGVIGLGLVGRMKRWLS